MTDLDSMQPGEQRTLAIDTSPDLPSGVTPSSATVAAIRTDTSVDVTATVLVSSTCTISGTQVIFTLKSLTHGVTYKLTFTITLSNGNTTKPDAMISCIEE